MEDNKEEKIDQTKSEKAQSSHHYVGLKVILLALVLLLVVGGVVGVAKLAFSDRNSGGRVAIERNVNFSRQGFGGRGMHQQVGNTITGSLSKIDMDTLVVHKASNNKDYTVLISDTTQIRKDNDIAGKSDLAIGQAITVQGSANSAGQITATYIIIN